MFSGLDELVELLVCDVPIDVRTLLDEWTNGMMGDSQTDSLGLEDGHQ